MLNSLEVRGFRGIRDLRINDLGFANIFIGANGAGKTTLLEAAGIVANPLNPGFLASFTNWRELPQLNSSSPDGLRWLFNAEFAQDQIRLGWSSGSQHGHLTIQPLRTGRVFAGDVSSDSSGSGQISSFDNITGVTYEYTGNKGVSLHAELQLNPTGHQIRGPDPNSVHVPGCFFIHARRSSSLGETARALTKAAEMRVEASLITAARKVEPSLVRLIPGLSGNQPIVLADVGLPRLIPSNLLGDGFSRVPLMLTGAVLNPGHLLIVDEIDSGLHHEIMSDCWKSLIELHRTSPFQIFCTTHSEEMLRSTLDAFESKPELLRIFRVDRNRGGNVTVTKYDFKTLSDATYGGLDIR